MLTEDALKYLASREGYHTVTASTDTFPSGVVAIPEKSRLMDLEAFQARPNRIVHNATLDSSAAFIEYVKRFKQPSTSIYLSIFAERPQFTAMLDHHDPAAPSWNKHLARFMPRVSLEWKAWTELHNGGEVDQSELLEFFEDHADDLYSPSPAEMLSHLQKFEEVEKHTYESAVNLNNGNVSITYVKGTAQRKVEFPHTFKVYIPLLENEAHVLLEGRLRYKTHEGSIGFTFQFKKDPTRIMRDVLRDLAEDIKGKTEAHCYEGITG